MLLIFADGCSICSCNFTHLFLESRALLSRLYYITIRDAGKQNAAKNEPATQSAQSQQTEHSKGSIKKYEEPALSACLVLDLYQKKENQEINNGMQMKKHVAQCLEQLSAQPMQAASPSPSQPALCNTVRHTHIPGPDQAPNHCKSTSGWQLGLWCPAPS